MYREYNLPFDLVGIKLFSFSGSEWFLLFLKVLLLDYGGIRTIDISQLRQLPANLLTAKQMAIAVSLHDIVPPGGQKVPTLTYFSLY